MSTKDYARSDSAMLRKNVPEQLKAARQFVCWKVMRREKEKPAKVPIDPNTGKDAKINDPSSWGSFDEAIGRFEADKGLNGIGFVFTASDPWTGLDIDDCRDPDSGEIGDWATEIISGLKSYTEISPSGTGVKIFLEGELPGKANRRNKIEIYSGLRYFTLTGMRVEGTPATVEPRQGPLADIYQTVFGPQGKEEEEAPRPPDPKLLRVQGLSDEDLLARARGAANGAKFQRLWDGDLLEHGGDASRADMSLCSILAYWTRADAERIDKLFRLSKLARKKWDSRRGPTTYGQRTVAAAIKGITALWDPDLDARAQAVQNDIANAEVFIQLHGGEFAWVGNWKSWLAWERHSWKRGLDHTVQLASENVSGELMRRVTEGPRDDEFQRNIKWAVKTGEAWRITNIQNLCKPRLHVDHKRLDKNPMLIACANGVLDLSSCELRDGKKDDWITRKTDVAYDPRAKCPKWDKFLREIMEGDEEMVSYLWRVIGYSITGDTSERTFFILHGTGRNGKSTFVETLLALLGDYGQKARFSTFIKKHANGGGANDDIAHLTGARMVAASEADETVSFDTSLIKELTGTDTVRARYLYSGEFEFKPNFKLFFATNQVPKIYESTFALWDRLHYVPFEWRVPDSRIDKKLPLNLLGELEGILSKAVQSCQEWQKEGLMPPDKVLRAKQVLRETMDTFGQFLNDCVEESFNKKVSQSLLYQAFLGWCKDQGVRYAPSSRALAAYLKDKKIESKMTNGNTKFFIGIHLRHHSEDF